MANASPPGTDLRRPTPMERFAHALSHLAGQTPAQREARRRQRCRRFNEQLRDDLEHGRR